MTHYNDTRLSCRVTNILRYLRSNLCKGNNRAVAVREIWGFFYRTDTKYIDSLSMCCFPDTIEA